MPSTEVSSEVIGRPPKKNTDKRFICPRCDRHFSRLEHLQRHDRTHTQERPFACQQCESRFTRSDLLIRHERLSHNKEKRDAQSQQPAADLTDTGGQSSRPETGRPAKRMRPSPRNRDTDGHEVSSAATPAQATPAGQYPDFASPSVAFQAQPSIERHQSFNDRPLHGQNYHTPLEALSLAAEQSAFQNTVTVPTPSRYTATDNAQAQTSLGGLDHTQAMPSAVNQSMGGMESEMPPPFGNFLDVSFDSFAAFLESSEPLSNHQFASFMPAEQPMSFFPLSSFANLNPGEGFFYNPSAARQPAPGVVHNVTNEEQTSFSRFGSRLPSLQPDEHDPPESQHPENEPSLRPIHHRRVWHVSPEDRDFIANEVAKFDTVHNQFQLPTRMSLARYIRAYVDGFQEHLPFLHVQSMTVEDSSVELLLAMSAVGAQYCFEAEKGVELFHAARAIATERIRRRDARVAWQQRDVEEPDYSNRSVISAVSTPAAQDRRGSNIGHTVNGPLGLPSDPGSGGVITSAPPKDDLMQSAQALLILMAMATWAKHKEILREALAIQSVLASIIRDDGLRVRQEEPSSWDDWIRYQSVLRTKFVVFCFFNLHSIVYDIPPLLLNSEIFMPLPCSTAEFKAESEVRWREARAKRVEPPAQFQDALKWLFSKDNDTAPGCHSSLGNYVLIHAIIQHIFLVRQTIRCRADADELTSDDVAPLEQALRRWQMGWNRSPESSIDPSDPNGPVAFNSTALLRLAYIRLNMDTGPGRALGTRDPLQIAHALREMPAIKRTPKLVRALLHSAHALSIPVKIGVRLVSKTQAFIWSIQHSLCSLECAILLSKWLETVSNSEPAMLQPPLSEDERKILSLVMTMLDETEFAVPAGKSLESPETAKHLSAGVLRVWATIFRGAQTWAIVDVIGSSLNIYADMLEAS
ncbi:zinc finger protein ADR1 [Coniochaeta sp. 2T2.1]|nr:zinc finger protein ADR1 [Coniochaeta sp. 2T2.1]